MKKLIENISFLFFCFVTLGAFLLVAVFVKNLPEFFKRDEI